MRDRVERSPCRCPSARGILSPLLVSTSPAQSSAVDRVCRTTVPAVRCTVPRPPRRRRPECQPASASPERLDTVGTHTHTHTHTRWQVILRDPMWHVSSRSGVAASESPAPLDTIGTGSLYRQSWTEYFQI